MGVAAKKKRKREEMIKSYPENDKYYRIFKNDKTLYRDESGRFKEINNYYYDNVEKVFTKGKIIVCAFVIFAYWALFTLFYTFAYSIPFWEAIFEFADNYLFLGGITLIIFFAFKRKKGYNKNKDKE